jgi:hypothetical protein
MNSPGRFASFRRPSDVKSAWVLLFVAVLLVALLCALTPIQDSDFFWHLASGKWIAQNHSLPETDPFAYTTPAVQTSRTHFILTAFWISQLLYYGLYSLLGWNGIILMKFPIEVAILIFIYRRGRSSDAVANLALTLIASLVIGELFLLERPQVFSVIFFSLLMCYLTALTDHSRSPSNALYFTLPATMLIWANMHPGVILGQGMIFLYIVFEGLKFLHPALSPPDIRSYKKLVFVGIAGIVASLVNPNGYRPIIELLNMSDFLRGSVTEYRTTPSFFMAFHSKALLLYWGLLLLAGLSVVYGIITRKADITQIAILAGTGYFSFTQTRYVVFFVVCAVPVIAQFVSRLRYMRVARAVLFSLSLAAFLYFLVGQQNWILFRNVDNFRTDRWVNPDYFPETAASFIKENSLEGNMFNFYDWGGYLIWRLYPDRKVFVDGRQLNEKVCLNSVAMLRAMEEPRFGSMPYYKVLFVYYDIGYVIIPRTYSDGKTIPLTEALFSDPQWRPVFSDNVAIIFVRNR